MLEIGKQQSRLATLPVRSIDPTPLLDFLS